MNTADGYMPADIERGRAWYAKHKLHVDQLVKNEKREYPMSGSDIRRPELWKAPAWKWFLSRFGL